MIKLSLQALGVSIITSAAAATGLGAQTTPVDSIDAAKRTAIEALLEITGAGELALTGMDATIPMQRRANPDIPDAFWDSFARRARSDIDQFLEMLIPIYDELFTLDDIQELMAFYRTPSGQRFIEVQPKLSTAVLQTSEQWGIALGTQVMEELLSKGSLDIR